MSEKEQIDTESVAPLNALLEAMPGGFNAIADIVERRAAVSEVFATVHYAGSRHNADKIEVRIYRPAYNKEPLPCLGFIHGGGMIMGDLDGNDMICQSFAEALQVAVASLDYRKAPEHPYPAACHDVVDAIKWLFDEAEELNLIANNIGLTGLSAGGGLTLAAALLLRDNGGPELKYLAPIYPMIDDRNTTPSSNQIKKLGIWDRAVNIEAWQWYLGGKAADGYAAPARMQDLSGLPPTYISVGTLDLFRDENIDFAMRLMQAGVTTELNVYPGAYHASEVMAPQARLSQRIMHDRLEALRRFIETPLLS